VLLTRRQQMSVTGRLRPQGLRQFQPNPHPFSAKFYAPFPDCQEEPRLQSVLFAGRTMDADSVDRRDREQSGTKVDNRRRLTIELETAKTLQAISQRLISESSGESLYFHILDAAITLMAADAASIQMLTAEQRSLVLLGWRNFHPESAAFWRRVEAEDGSTCARALRDNERVLVSDVESCDFMVGTGDLEEYRRSGIRAVQSTPLRSRSGQSLGMLSTHWRVPHTPTDDDFMLFDVLAREAADLIDRSRAEDAVRESERRFRLIANTAPVKLWMSDVDQRWTFVNQRWLNFTGRPLEATLGHQWAESVHPDDLARVRETYANAFERRASFQTEYQLRRHDGEFRWIASGGVPRFEADGSFAGFVGSALDITDRKRAEEALSTLSQRLIEAQEGERARLARELHDDINQRLALVIWQLEGLARDAQALPAHVANQIARVREEVVALGCDVQALSHRLHPPRLGLLGLELSAAALCREVVEQQGMEINFRAEAIPKRLSPRISLCFYRVLQEALQNAIKHSGVRRVDVSLCGGGDQIELVIRDAGVGFDAEKAARKTGLGLTSMPERMKALHGQLFIDSTPGCGTSVRACLTHRDTRQHTSSRKNGD
jgi:PAS domain S-box-containing protein